MKQPLIFKEITEKYKQPIDHKIETFHNLDRLREIALDAIYEYKSVKKQIEEMKRERKELVDYLNYLDKLENT